MRWLISILLLAICITSFAYTLLGYDDKWFALEMNDLITGSTYIRFAAEAHEHQANYQNPKPPILFVDYKKSEKTIQVWILWDIYVNVYGITIHTVRFGRNSQNDIQAWIPLTSKNSTGLIEGVTTMSSKQFLKAFLSKNEVIIAYNNGYETQVGLWRSAGLSRLMSKFAPELLSSRNEQTWR